MTPQQIEEMNKRFDKLTDNYKKYAGRWHEVDCAFPEVDRAVCNCNHAKIKKEIKSFLQSEISLAVEQEKEKILEFILSEEIEMQVGDNINELLDYRGISDCGKSMRGGSKEKVLEPLVARIKRNFNQQ